MFKYKGQSQEEYLVKCTGWMQGPGRNNPNCKCGECPKRSVKKEEKKEEKKNSKVNIKVETQGTNDHKTYYDNQFGGLGGSGKSSKNYSDNDLNSNLDKKSKP